MKENGGYVEKSSIMGSVKKYLEGDYDSVPETREKIDADEVNITLKTVAVIVNADPDDRGCN